MALTLTYQRDFKSEKSVPTKVRFVWLLFSLSVGVRQANFSKMWYEAVYQQLFVTNADPRVAKWPLMQDSFKLTGIIGLYLYAVYFYLPNYMKNRKPYDLKLIIQTYNVFQLTACTYLFYGMGINGWFNDYTVGCQPVDYSNHPKAINMLNLAYFTIWVKLSEFAETCFFLLRNKKNQVSFLHVYHHITTLLFAWITTKYMGGGMVTFAIFVNTGVHIIMYMYYFLAALGPDIQARMAFIKPKITMIQMGQFWILLFHSLQVFNPNCNISPLVGLFFAPNMVVLFSFFYNFYLKSYKNKTK